MACQEQQDIPIAACSLMPCNNMQPKSTACAVTAILLMTSSMGLVMNPFFYSVCEYRGVTRSQPLLTA